MTATHTRYALGCTCPPCMVTYLETASNTCTYGKPRKPRYSHAVPDGATIALCGAIPNGPPATGDLPRCPDCEAHATRREFITR